MGATTYREYINQLNQDGFDRDIIMALRKAYNEYYRPMLDYLNRNKDLGAFQQYRRLLDETKKQLDVLGAVKNQEDIGATEFKSITRRLRSSFDTLRTLTAMFVHAPDEGVEKIAKSIINSGRVVK